jgi:hypothetical protein
LKSEQLLACLSEILESDFLRQPLKIARLQVYCRRMEFSRILNPSFETVGREYLNCSFESATTESRKQFCV